MLDDHREPRKDRASDGCPSFNEVARHLELVALAGTPEKRVSSVSIRTLVVLAVHRVSNVKLHLFHEELEHVELAGSARREHERWVHERIEIRPEIHKVFENVETTFDAGDKKGTEAFTGLKIRPIFDQKSYEIKTATLDGRVDGRSIASIDSSIGSTLEKNLGGGIVTSKGGSVDCLLCDLFGVSFFAVG